MRRVVPSVLTSDPKELKNKVKILESYADIIQIDIMDGELVPNVSVSIEEVLDLRTSAELEMHLMVRKPSQYIEPFAKMGAKKLIFHIEADDDPKDLINRIRELNAEPGIAINPPTALETMLPFVGMIDIALVMGVNPGFQGQKFIPEVLQKVRRLKQIRPDVPIELDGGVNPETAPMILNAGVDILNVGSFLFKDGDVGTNWQKMQQIIANS